jgi:hypothetical protein
MDDFFDFATDRPAKTLKKIAAMPVWPLYNFAQLDLPSF